MGSDSFDFKRYITNPELIFEGFSRITSGYSAYKKKDQFRMQVLNGAKVLAGTSPPRYYFKARIIDDDSPHVFYPNPCDNTIATNSDRARIITSFHTTVLADSDPGVGVGDIIDATMEPGSGTSIYNLQYARFLKISTARENDLTVRSECYELSTYDWNSGDFLGDIGNLLPIEQETGIRFDPRAPVLSLLYQRMLTLLKATPLLDGLRSAEAGQNPDVYNAVDNRSGYPAGRSRVVSRRSNTARRNMPGIPNSQANGPKITELTFNQMRLIQLSDSTVSINSKIYDYRIPSAWTEEPLLLKPFAVGLYQFIPSTLKSILSYYTPLLQEKFDYDNQTLACIILIMNKSSRRALANYILGEVTTNDPQIRAARRDLALEWASMPAGYDFKAGSIATNIPAKDVAPADGMYDEPGVNSASSRVKPDEPTQWLNDARQKLADDPEFQKLYAIYKTYAKQSGNSYYRTTGGGAQAPVAPVTQQ